MSGIKGKSGGKRTGAGRPAYFKVRQDEWLIVERSSLDGNFQPPELGRVVGIENDELELQIGNDILVIRVPDDGEITVSL